MFVEGRRYVPLQQQVGCDGNGDKGGDRDGDDLEKGACKDMRHG